MMQKLVGYLYKILYPLALTYWFIVRPKTEGVRCIILHEDKILLIKHTYGNQLLTSVGGGIKKDESPENAVAREAKEEVGVSLLNIKHVESFLFTGEYKKDTVHIFIATAESTKLKTDPKEIAFADWYKLDSLPKNISTTLISRIERDVPIYRKT